MTAPTNADTANEIVAWYAMPVGEVVQRHGTSMEKGLGASEASSRLEKYGPNRLPEGKKRGPFMRFLSQFNNILVFVLLGAGFIKLMLNLWVDASIIFGVVILNALLGFVQEGKAEKALDSIRNMLSAEARTIRDGETRIISAEELVPGDVVLLESGDKVPADLRLADAKNFRTEEAALTEGEIKKDGQPVKKDSVLGLMGQVSMLCNDAELFQQEGTWKVEGDPTEGALYPFAAKLGMDRETERGASPRIDVIPFESEHKFMATLHKSAAGKEMLLVKGAPEVILQHCDRQQTSDGTPPSLDRNYFIEASDKLASQGERVLALAWLENPAVQKGLSAADLPKTLVLIGLIGLLDPPRKEAVEAVKECHSGGIRVTMITGDHKITAAAIAKMLGIGDGKTALTGTEIEEMSAATLQEKVRDVDVFARASPEHKLRLVKAIQANKQIVAMTGDGVNDAPALKKADIGVAMGIKGTEVTKEAAEMILADDNFASITAAVKEGRTVYNNIEKAILFMLPTNVA
ncbi:MAG: HAD-IC family P-type ATPase, partial [Pseudolabrys sp.]